MYTQGQLSFKSGTQILHLGAFDASSRVFERIWDILWTVLKSVLTKSKVPILLRAHSDIHIF